MPIKLKLYNTQTRKKEEFSPVTPGKATLYVCGVTPYDYSHIGHGRSYVNFDVLVRTLKFLGLATTYIRNLTDIDDKLLKKAAAAGNIESYLQITQVYIDDYHEQMQKLGNLAPDVEPRATQSIDSMIKIIKTLLEKGHAYHLDSDIYFDVSTFPKYGKLSGKNIDDLLEGSRVEIRTGKKNPGDFALWKGNTDGKFWKTPWGHGRPGWHIECSAMIHDQSNTSIDIHGGGADLIFPHHENEIAQSEAAFGYPLANIWVHNALLNLDKAKMSKSVGNTLSLNKVLQTVEPMTLRYYFLLHSYQTPIEFGKVGLKAAEKGLNKLRKILAGSETTKDLTLEDIDTQNKFVSSLVESLCDDLNTPKLLGLIFKNSDQIVSSPTICSQVASLVTNVLGISLKQNKQETAQKALLSSKEV
ncbi:cysteine--tRNA ligase, partial [Candidatus Babeliales bacterium]|nr:cysteine--tRNA ligase [Candidatus Babeliales bacterium]